VSLAKGEARKKTKKTDNYLVRKTKMVDVLVVVRSLGKPESKGPEAPLKLLSMAKSKKGGEVG